MRTKRPMPGVQRCSFSPEIKYGQRKRTPFHTRERRGHVNDGAPRGLSPKLKKKSRKNLGLRERRKEI